MYGSDALELLSRFSVIKALVGRLRAGKILWE